MRAPLINSAKENPGAMSLATGAIRKAGISNGLYSKFIDSLQA
jgi:hypothetical protein